MSQERLQRIIARAGVASRRAAEELITGGRVRVNGRIIDTLGAKADAANDKVEVDGRRLAAESPVYFVLHKPRGVVSTLQDPEGRSTVRQLLGRVGERVFPVGRLDYHTSGVLLLTNDGDFCDALIHPKRKVPKTYVLKVAGEMREPDRKRWAEGVAIEGGTTAPAEVFILRHERGKTWLEVTLLEGKNQQIRRMGEATGFAVMRLSRTSFGGITSEGLRPGDYRPLTIDELKGLRELFGVPKKIPRAQSREVRAAPTERTGPPRAPRGDERKRAVKRTGKRGGGRGEGRRREGGRGDGGRTMSHQGPADGGRRLTQRRPASTGKGGG